MNPVICPLPARWNATVAKKNAEAESRKMTGVHVARAVRLRVDAVSPVGDNPESFAKRLRYRIARCLSDAEKHPGTPTDVIQGLRAAVEGWAT